MDERPEWFAPKRYGFGAGLPIAWQGWAVLAGFAMVVGVSIGVFGPRNPMVAVLIVPAIAALIVVMVRTTKGGFRWRWGDRK